LIIDVDRRIRMSIELSLVIPALNEAGRLPAYLDAIAEYLPSAIRGRYEVLVVDDGSCDGTDRLVMRRAEIWPELALLRHPVNRGKGAAVRTGMLASRGRVVLFADADGACPIGEEALLRAAIENGADLAVGSRTMALASECDRPPHRRLVAAAFTTLRQTLLPLPVQDTQCGFKMFRGDVGRRLFESVVESGYLFDLEILVLAARCGHRIDEVPVRWTEQPGSKVSLVRDSWRMIRGLLRLRRAVGLATAAGTVPGEGKLDYSHLPSPDKVDAMAYPRATGPETQCPRVTGQEP
jgi:dolichyl-phosphate beta-glucosyltransferase